MRKPAHVRRQLRSFLIACTFLCAFSFLSKAQRYSFREYTQGLGNLNIDCMVQDRVGYLWVGTQNGLYRYDGAQFQSFGPAQGLPERTIQNLFVGADGTLWVATSTGIFFETKDGHFAPVDSSGPQSQFLQRSGTVFTAHGSNALVTITRSGAFRLRRVAPERWAAEPMHLEGASLWSVQYPPNGSLWYGCDSDLCRLQDGKTTRLRDSLNLPEEQWTNLLFARDGHLWLRGNHHIGELDPSTGRFQIRDVPGADTESYPAPAEDAKGRILTAQGSSLALWQSDDWRMVTEHNGLSRFEIQTLFVDREGSLWIGLVGHGILRWVGQDKWEGYTVADGLSNDLIWSVMRDHTGKLWIGTESGLDYIPAGDVNPRRWHQPGIIT
ncbi:MAG TPA: two-component regulator propeller domain-containing protein, partial [Terriglobales bacterium]|nr:two-component regulator propeller domain-containing protein [Terriglobales bacterium]